MLKPSYRVLPIFNCLPNSGNMDRIVRNRRFESGKTGFDIYGLTLKKIGVRTAKKTDKSVFFALISFLVYQYGADDRIRTGDLRLTKALRYHLCHISMSFTDLYSIAHPAAFVKCFFKKILFFLIVRISSHHRFSAVGSVSYSRIGMSFLMTLMLSLLLHPGSTDPGIASVLPYGTSAPLPA